MEGTSNVPLSRASTSPTDPQFHSEPPYSASNASGSPHLSVARLAGAFLSGGGARVPVNVNGTSGGGAPPQTDCKMVEVHGAKVASFTVNGVELICLPQVFELFLKHLVGGLHTVYTKLKRLEISPVVCSVEQVRILRGLGAIQPGVNRCKLITRADFETLYRDCTNARWASGERKKFKKYVDRCKVSATVLLFMSNVSPCYWRKDNSYWLMSPIKKKKKKNQVIFKIEAFEN